MLPIKSFIVFNVFSVAYPHLEDNPYKGYVIRMLRK